MTVLSLTPGQMVYFCLGVCYPPRTDNFEMPDNDAVTLDPGEETTGLKFFDVALIPYGIEGSASVKMTFFVLGSPSDSIEYTVVFNSVTSVAENRDVPKLFAEPEPNPASDYILFNYNLSENANNANIEIYNFAGSLIDRIPINSSVNGIKYNTMHLPCGGYYSVLNTGGKEKAAKSFIISR